MEFTGNTSDLFQHLRRLSLQFLEELEAGKVDIARTPKTFEDFENLYAHWILATKRS